MLNMYSSRGAGAGSGVLAPVCLIERQRYMQQSCGASGKLLKGVDWHAVDVLSV